MQRATDRTRPRCRHRKTRLVLDDREQAIEGEIWGTCAVCGKRRRGGRAQLDPQDTAVVSSRSPYRKRSSAQMKKGVRL